jgi:hypothetical protein
MRIQKRIYLIADSEQKYNGFGTERKLIGSYDLKVINSHITKNTKNKNDNMIK